MFNRLHILLFFVTVFNCYSLSSTNKLENTQLQCKNEENQPVDWFYIYKLPKTSQTSNPLIKKGLAYAYITSETSNDGWKLSEKSIGSKTSIPGYTLAPLYKRNDSIFWTLYNDHAPNETAAANYGHTKGAVVADLKQGFWLVHSVPRYPPAPANGTDPPAKSQSEQFSDQEYSYPSTGQTYGQSFLCISVDKDQFDTIGTQLMYNQIITYKNNLPDSVAEHYPILTKAANKIRIKNAPYNHKATIKSLGNTVFSSFAKSNKWEKDLYDDFVAPQLGSDLLAETWIHGAGKLPSECTGAKVMNVESINFAKADIVFKTLRDHSKWAVSNIASKNRNWVCVGDINRAQGQLERGGGTVCLNSKSIWTSYHQIVNDVELCPSRWKRFVNWISNVF